MLTTSCEESNQPVEDDLSKTQTVKDVTAKDILGNPDYLAISYGGYRETSRDQQPTIEQLKEDMKILYAMDIRVLRTYNVHLAQAANLLEAIHQLKQADPTFEMYVMLGAWINCKGGFTDQPDHSQGDAEGNAKEIARAVELTNQYPDIVKIIAVGNEAMVKWAASYFVQPDVILKWVNHLQDLKQKEQLPKDLWVTSSDNFASWGGGGSEYHVADLKKLYQAVDFISLHTYPMHDTHYNPDFWGNVANEDTLSATAKIEVAMLRARDYAKSQYENTVAYMKSLDVDKPVHIGETGWATSSNGFYGDGGSKATDEYKEAYYYNLMREWTNTAGISCFYFEAFDENWKDAGNPGGSENYFGLFDIDGQAKYALWDLVDQGVFEGLGRNGKPVSKTYDGDKEALLLEVMLPPMKAASVGAN
ncbi:MAG: glycosyl hydrolase family 17 protein [Saprospiraceae bacterium]